MSTRFITLKKDARGVATLTLARADKHNALNAAMMDELRDAAAVLGADETLRAVVLAADGETFCAGGDLGWMQEQFTRDRQGRMTEARRLASILKALDEMPKLLIGRVQGAAYGGGVGMMAVCDIVVAAPSVRLALTEARLGMIAATIAPYVLRRIGEGAARRMLLNSKVLSAEQAAAMGLVSVVAHDLDEAVEAEVAAALECAPGAIAAAKALCREIARAPSVDHLELTVERLADRWETEEVRDGIDAFLLKKKPSWRA